MEAHSEILEPLPLMDGEGLDYFRRAMQSSKCLLEYGCGGSTVYAANVANVERIISVESDKAWAQKVTASIRSARSQSNVIHCDIGPVGGWGYPASSESINSFWQYMAAPWEVAASKRCLPDTVLIDGRFRVASFLYTILVCTEGTMIMFDDYFDRPEYHIVEEFIPYRERCGRMAVFEAKKNYNLHKMVQQIAKYSVIPA